jgi:hypothetical protein
VTTTLDSPAVVGTPNATLAEALDTLARLLRDPRTPEVFSLRLDPTDYRRNAWKASLLPASSGEDAEVQALRTFAGLLGPDATFHLADPRHGDEGAFRTLTTRAVRDGLHLEMWTRLRTAG